MANLVQIPWQPTLWLTPQTLARLVTASRILGRNIYLNGSDAAWRSYASQKYQWDLNGHNPAKANNPDVGDRVHMRGAGLDVPTDAKTQAAMKAAGFVRDKNETWHWSDPNWRNMPIIETNTGTAGGGSSAIGGFLMALSDAQQDQMYKALVQPTADGNAYYKTDAIMNILRLEVETAIAAIAAGGIAFPGASYNAFVAIVNTVRGAAGQEPVDVDEKELAAQLAPALAPLLAENVGTLTDATVDELVQKLLDEQAKRLAK